MSGIGFQLKGLFKEKGYFYSIRGYFISTMVTVGPTVLCIFLITAMQFLLKSTGESYKNIELFLVVIVYCFAFSLIITGGIIMLAARYVADCIYEKQLNKILPSMFGLVIIVLMLGFFSINIFFIKSSINIGTKILAYLIFSEISIIWIESIYLTAIKDYIAVVVSFLIGIIAIFIMFEVFNILLIMTPLSSALFSIMFGFLIIAVLFTIKLYELFGGVDLSLKSCLEVLKVMDKYGELIIIGMCYYLGMYVHNFVFWISDQGTIVANTFRVAPFYDVPMFYAFLTIIPITVIFTVKLETSIYPKYKHYYALAQGKGSIKDLKRAKEDLIGVLSTELKYMMEIQLFITFAFIIFGMRILPSIGFTLLSTNIFAILTLGSFAYVSVFLVLIVLLYFDHRKGAMNISILFFTTNLIFTIITIYLGSGFYGYGFFASALFSVIISFIKLDSFLRDIDYYTFAAQPIIAKKINGVFTKLYNLL
ncbi:MAG: exopolysaccharide Pel transporter PelG [Bacillota bacterium]|nr:exopolysaccharide Pel transporter PelG [Bacillota bacterium]